MIITPGIYKAQVTEAEWLENRKKNGHYIKVTFKLITYDQFKGYKVSFFFNFDNPNEEAEAIALRKWTLFCMACELNLITFPWKKGPQDNQLLGLIGKILEIQIGIYKGHNGFDNNEVTDFYMNKDLPQDTKSIEMTDKTPEPDKSFDNLNDDIPF